MGEGREREGNAGRGDGAEILVHNTGMLARVTTILDIATAWKQVGAKFKHGIETTVDFIRDLFIHQKKIHVEISDILKQMYPGEKGFSERTVRRYC